MHRERGSRPARLFLFLNTEPTGPALCEPSWHEVAGRDAGLWGRIFGPGADSWTGCFVVERCVLGLAGSSALSVVVRPRLAGLFVR